MASTDKKTTFAIGLDNQLSPQAKEATRSVEQMASAIEGAESRLKDYGQQLRGIKGKSEEANKAREKLKAGMNVDREVVSKNTLALIKNGTSVAQLTKQKKAAEEHTKKLAEAQKKTTQTLEPLTSKFGAFADLLTGASSAEELAVLGAAGLVAAIAAVAAGAVVGAAALAKFIFASRDLARNQGLAREAITGSAQQAEALGSQVDALARKVATPKAALNDLAVGLAKTRLQGEQLVDAFNAIGQANEALGTDAGSKIQALLERGAQTQRFSIGDDRWSSDLEKTGLKRDDIAKQLAKNLKVSVEEARMALASGRVKLTDGAKALRQAVEEKVGGINLRKMLSLEVIGQKLSDTFTDMTKGVDIEPLLRGFKVLADVFDQTSFSGAALKKLITIFGNTLATTFEKLAPFGAEFFKGIIIAGLDLAITFYKIRNSLKASFGDTKLFENVDWMKTALDVGRITLYAFGAALAVVGAALAVAAIPFIAFGSWVVGTFEDIETVAQALFDYFGATSWSDLGKRVVDGLVNGLKDGASRVVDQIKSLGESAKNAFKVALGIHSPSKEFAKLGQYTAQGYQQGIEKETPATNDALIAMAAPPPLSSGAAGGGFGGGGVEGNVFNINITVNTKSDKPEDVAAAVGGEGVNQLLKGLELAVMGRGLPVGG